MKFINDRLQMLYKCYKKKFLRKFNFFLQVTYKLLAKNRYLSEVLFCQLISSSS